MKFKEKRQTFSCSSRTTFNRWNKKLKIKMSKFRKASNSWLQLRRNSKNSKINQILWRIKLTFPRTFSLTTILATSSKKSATYNPKSRDLLTKETSSRMKSKPRITDGMRCTTKTKRIFLQKLKKATLKEVFSKSKFWLTQSKIRRTKFNSLWVKFKLSKTINKIKFKTLNFRS